MKLNSLIKTYKKIRPGRGIGSAKAKLQVEDIKVKNQDLVLL